MARFVVGDHRSQSTLFPERLDEYLGEDNPVRAIDVFVDELDLAKLGFGGVEPEATGRPAYHPRTLLKIYVYGYLNRVQSSRRLERECQRNIEPCGLNQSCARMTRRRVFTQPRSGATDFLSPRWVRFTPKSDHCADVALGPREGPKSGLISSRRLCSWERGTVVEKSG